MAAEAAEAQEHTDVGVKSSNYWGADDSSSRRPCWEDRSWTCRAHGDRQDGYAIVHDLERSAERVCDSTRLRKRLPLDSRSHPVWSPASGGDQKNPVVGLAPKGI